MYKCELTCKHNADAMVQSSCRMQQVVARDKLLEEVQWFFTVEVGDLNVLRSSCRK